MTLFLGAFVAGFLLRTAFPDMPFGRWCCLAAGIYIAAWVVTKW